MSYNAESSKDLVTTLNSTKDLGTVRRLLDQGADPNVKTDLDESAPLHHAAMNGDAAVVALLISKGADVHQTNDCGATPLHGASTPEVVQALLDGGAVVDAKDEYDSTPLHSAGTRGLAEVYRALLRAGADDSLRDRWGNQPELGEGIGWIDPAHDLVTGG